MNDATPATATRGLSPAGRRGADTCPAAAPRASYGVRVVLVLNAVKTRNATPAAARFSRLRRPSGRRARPSPPARVVGPAEPKSPAFGRPFQPAGPSGAPAAPNRRGVARKAASRGLRPRSCGYSRRSAVSAGLSSFFSGSVSAGCTVACVLGTVTSRGMRVRTDRRTGGRVTAPPPRPRNCPRPSTGGEYGRRRPVRRRPYRGNSIRVPWQRKPRALRSAPAFGLRFPPVPSGPPARCGFGVQTRMDASARRSAVASSLRCGGSAVSPRRFGLQPPPRNPTGPPPAPRGRLRRARKPRARRAAPVGLPPVGAVPPFRVAARTPPGGGLAGRARRARTAVPPRAAAARSPGGGLAGPPGPAKPARAL